MAEKWAGGKGLRQGRVFCAAKAVVSLDTSRAAAMLWTMGSPDVSRAGTPDSVSKSGGCGSADTHAGRPSREEDYNFAVLTGISVYVNVAAIVCAMVALPLFIGTKRQTRFDKNNLVGFVLLGAAVLLHGGFLTVLRSSPHAVFSGYVLGWSGGGEDTESSLWIYDLGFPPADESTFPNAPYRNLHVTRSRTDNVPLSFWNSGISEHVKCEYRIWDLEITRIDAVPAPNAKQTGLVVWQWNSHSQGRAWPLIEGLLGFLVTCWAILRLARKKPTSELSPSDAVRRFPNKWAARIYITSVALILAWIVFVRLSDRLFQFKAQSLLRDIQQLELRRSNWQDAQRIRARYGKHVSTDAACSPVRCDISVMLDHWYKFRSSSNGNTSFGRFVWTAWSLPRGRWAFIDATVRIRDGVVWGKDFDATISHRDDYPLIATAETTRDFATRTWYVSPDTHPNIRFGRPGGCEICQALWVKITPYASIEEVRDAFAFDLSCIGATLRPCTQMSQIMPVAARLLEEDSRSYNSGGQPPMTWSAAMIRALGRDAQNAAVVDILRVYREKSDDSGDGQQYADYKIIETIKGTFQVPIQPVRLSRQPTIDLRNLPQRAVMFGFERNDIPALVPLTDDTLREVRSGVAEDAVDIPRKW